MCHSVCGRKTERERETKIEGEIGRWGGQTEEVEEVSSVNQQDCCNIELDLFWLVLQDVFLWQTLSHSTSLQRTETCNNRAICHCKPHNTGRGNGHSQ